MKQYHEVLKDILKNGVDRESHGSATRALFVKEMRFDMADGFPVVTTKKVPFDMVKAELLWFLSGSTNVNDLKKFAPTCKIWDADAEKESWKPRARFEGDLGRIYSAQWRDWVSSSGKHVDQIAEVIARIKKDPHDRRHIVTAWNPGELDQMALPPCHTFFQFFSANGTLSMAMYQRSCDMFLGVPFNIASYALLLHMVAQVTGLKPDKFVHVLADTHIYHNHFPQVEELLAREPYPLPKLWLNPGVKDINSFTMEDIKLLDYRHHEPIKAPMTVRKGM